MDVIELREKGWEPRREQLEGKKLGEIHAEAQHVLGIPSFAPAANSAASLRGPEQSPSIEENLFTDVPVGKDKAVPVASGKNKVEVEEGKYSALFGGYQPSSTAKRLSTQEEHLKQQQEERRQAVPGSPCPEPKRRRQSDFPPRRSISSSSRRSVGEPFWAPLGPCLSARPQMRKEARVRALQRRRKSISPLRSCVSEASTPPRLPDAASDSDGFTDQHPAGVP